MRLAPRPRTPWILLPLAASLAGACGDDAGPAAPDAAIAVDAPPAGGCTHTEARDLTNDDVLAMGTPERTEATLATRVRVCGAVDAGHFDLQEAVVDVDGYVVTVAADADVLVTLAGAGLGALGLVQLQLYGGAGLRELVLDTRVVGDHAVGMARVPAGTYELVVIASNMDALTASLPYTLDLAVDDPGARCPEVTTGGYAEAADGAAHDGNDVVLLDRSQSPTSRLTPATTDAPEPTAIALAPGQAARLAGTSAAVARAGSYFDKDTYAFTTGATTNQVALRVTWPGTTADLDLHLFRADQVPFLHRSITTAMVSPELTTVAVEPSTTYWLWIGADRSSTGLPVAYAATLCGEAFAAGD